MTMQRGKYYYKKLALKEQDKNHSGEISGNKYVICLIENLT